MNINGTNVFSSFLIMKAQDYLTALKVVREIQREQAYSRGCADPWLAQTLQTIELYAPLDFSYTCARVTRKELIKAYDGKLFQ